jgi:hypothetical protein
MKHIKNSFLFFTLFLTTFVVQGNLLTTLFNKVAYSSLIRSLSLRYEMFLKTRALNRLEQTYKIVLTNQLNQNSEYISLDNRAYKLFSKNYFMQKDLGGQTMSHTFSKLFHGAEFIKKHDNELKLYNKLCDERNKIFLKAYKEIYTKNYYSKKRDLASKRRLLNEDIPLKWLQKSME